MFKLIQRSMSTKPGNLRGKKHNYQFDLVVIGAGSGGVRAARISGGHGAKVALVETSLNHGPPTYTAIVRCESAVFISF